MQSALHLYSFDFVLLSWMWFIMAVGIICSLSIVKLWVLYVEIA